MWKEFSIFMKNRLFNVLFGIKRCYSGHTHCGSNFITTPCSHVLHRETFKLLPLKANSNPLPVGMLTWLAFINGILKDTVRTEAQSVPLWSRLPSWALASCPFPRQSQTLQCDWRCLSEPEPRLQPKTEPWVSSWPANTRARINSSSFQPWFGGWFVIKQIWHGAINTCEYLLITNTVWKDHLAVTYLLFWFRYIYIYTHTNL